MSRLGFKRFVQVSTRTNHLRPFNLANLQCLRICLRRFFTFYGGVDIAMSIYSLSRLVIKPDAWRLFRYMPSDNVRAYRTMRGSSLGIEASIDAETAAQMYKRMPK
ncbi:DUF4225 domain-containing protein [Pseudomonas kitaguniensis]|uniref:DUF4225 domain-containing protein n=1 Tax=Pseudomonas kitaguniensis TaxID=2607908 RepID=UPI003CFF81CD